MATSADNNGTPPPPPDVWKKDEDLEVHYQVRHPWEWVMKNLGSDEMKEVVESADLPTAKESKIAENDSSDQMGTSSNTPSSNRRRRQRNRVQPSTLKLEITNAKTGQVDYAVHGSSAALDGLEDKDELVRTIKRCRADQLLLSPPSVLINWDVSHDECINVVGEELPTLDGRATEDTYAVLKEPMGSQGKGIYFVKNAEDIHKVINEHRLRALEEPTFLDNLIAVKGRIPSWVLQAEVRPSLLIRDRRKFHIRTYLVVLEKLHHPDLMAMYMYNRHEIRIAGTPVQEGDTERDPLAHITNGALSNTTERVLLDTVPELKGMQAKIEAFVAETFGKHLMPEMARRINYSASLETDSRIRKFALAGLDLMVTEQGRIFLLEVNVNPAAPPQAMVDDAFVEHLNGFLHDLIDLLVGAPSPNFLHLPDLLARTGK